MPRALPLFVITMTTTPDIIVTDVKKVVTMTWTAAMEERLFESLVEMVCAGKRAESGFKKEAWNHCVIKVKDVMRDSPLKEHLDVKKCKSKMDINKQQWREFDLLMHKSGWSFDSVTERFIAGDDEWEAHIAVSITFIIIISSVLIYSVL